MADVSCHKCIQRTLALACELAVPQVMSVLQALWDYFLKNPFLFSVYEVGCVALRKDQLSSRLFQED